MKIEKKDNLYLWDFPVTRDVFLSDEDNEPTSIPELTEENFWTLIEDYNIFIKNFNDNIDALKKEVEELKLRK
jgi:hypothetical protein